MARKKSTEGGGSSLDLLGVIASADSSLEILTKSQVGKIREYIPTGHYTLNASLSGSLFGGIPSGRIVEFAGEKGTGKSYLCMDCMREAQKMGYTCLLFDSENSYDVSSLDRFGIDTDKLILKQTNSIEEIGGLISKLTTNLKAQYEKQLASDPDTEKPRLMIVIDSFGALTTTSGIDQVASGEAGKLNLTKQKYMAQVFRAITTPLGQLDIPMIVTNHVYVDQGSYVPTAKAAGGEALNYNASIIMMLSKAKLDGKDAISDKLKQESEDLGIEIQSSGCIVTCNPTKTRFAKPIKSKFYISFFTKNNPYIGLEKFLTWDNVGIERGKILEKREYEKLSDADKAKCRKFDALKDKDTGETTEKYFQPKETARGYVVKHLGVSVPANKIFCKSVFTDDILELLDEKVIRPNYELPSKAEMMMEEDIDLSEGDSIKSAFDFSVEL